jgi:hypothetical protein
MSQDGAHTSFVYGLHHFCKQSSDNSETRWYDLRVLMQNASVSILCMVF